MAKTMGPRAVDSDLDLEALAREELLRLQRQYRLMENDRKAYAEESGTTVSRQQGIVRFLEKEKIDLMTDLTNALSPPNIETDKETIRQILHILELYTQHQVDIEHQLGQIGEMEEQVDKITHRVVQQKLKVQLIFGHSLTVPQAQKRTRVLENRLYHVTTLCDTQVSRNKCIREEIDMNLMERGRFHNRFEANKLKLGKMKLQMAELVDVATSTYDQREEATSKIRALRERNDKESKQHVLEMKEYQRVLHHDEKGHGFLVTKSKARPLLEEDDVRQQRLDKAKEKQLDDLLMAYKISFRDLLVFANTHDVETLVQKYKAQEQQNFAKFKYISDLNNEVDAIQDAIRILKADIEEKCFASKRRKCSMEKTLTDLDKTHKTAVADLADLVNQWEHAESNMEKIISAIEDVFINANCGNAAIIQLLGNQAGISPRNATLCMSVLEHRITELQFEKSVLEIRKFVEIDGGQLPSKAPTTLQGPKPKPTGGPFKPKVLITGRLDPAAEEEDETEDKTQMSKPISYEEMRNMLLAKLRENSTDQSGSLSDRDHRESTVSIMTTATGGREDGKGTGAAPSHKSLIRSPAP